MPKKRKAKFVASCGAKYRNRSQRPLPEAVSNRIRRKICQYFVAIMRSVTLKAGRQNEQFPPTVQELRKKLLSFCQKHPIAKLEVFGSVADGTAKPGRDVDLMVTFR